MMPSPSAKGGGADLGKEEVEKKGTRTRLRHLFKRHSDRETKEPLENNGVKSTDQSNLDPKMDDNLSSSQTGDTPAETASREPALQSSPPVPDTSSKLSSNMKPSALWSRAYDNLKHENREMVTEYELLLSTTGEPGQDNNTIAQFDADERKAQMDEIMRAGKKHYDEKAVKYKLFGTEHALEDDIASAVNVVLWGKDWIGEAVKASPEASLAWAGVSAVLPLLTNARRTDESGSNINITHVMPGPENRSKRIKITGPRDEAINRYRDWHCGQVANSGWKQHFHNIARLTFNACLSLEEIFKARESDEKYFVSQKIPHGIVRQWMSMVQDWVAHTTGQGS